MFSGYLPLEVSLSLIGSLSVWTSFVWIHHLLLATLHQSFHLNLYVIIVYKRIPKISAYAIYNQCLCYLQSVEILCRIGIVSNLYSKNIVDVKLKKLSISKLYYEILSNMCIVLKKINTKGIFWISLSSNFVSIFIYLSLWGYISKVHFILM